MVKKKKFDFYRFYRGYGREKRGAPPPVKTVTKETIRFLPFFTADMVEKKRRPPGKNGKTIKISIFTVFTADMVEKKGAPPR